MRKSYAVLITVLLTAAPGPLRMLWCSNATAPQQLGKAQSGEARSMDRKVAHLKQNAARAHPDPKPTVLTEPEVDAYFNEGGVKLPKGVSQVHLAAKPGSIEGRAQVDFEQIMQGRSSNPLYGMFSGHHEVHTISQAGGANHVGTVRIQSVDLDGIQIPQFALEWFVQHYLTQKYPNVGMTSTFKLPLRIDNAVVEAGKLSLIQK